MSLTLARLQLFCCVVEEGGMAAASRRMNCVPSNVVARIKELERDLGKELFLRDKGKISATPFGRLFYREAKHLLDKADCLNAFMATDTRSALLNVGALDVALIEFLPGRLPGYLKRYPGVEISLLRRPSLTLERMLEAGEIDVALTDGPIQHPLLHSRLAYQEDFYLVMPRSPAFDLHSAPAMKTFMFNDDCFYRDHFDVWLRRHEVTISATLTMESYEAIVPCVAAGLGISCFPGSIAKRLDAPLHRIQMVKLDDLEPSEIHFVWRRNSRSDSLGEFIEQMCGAGQPELARPVA